MSGRPLALTLVSSAILLTGCASLDATPKVDEAGSLAEQRLGRRPEWTAPYDEVSSWSAGEVLTLDRAIATGLRNNRDLRADLEMIGQANADLVQAGLLQNPVINFMMMFPDGGGRSMLQGQGLPLQPLQDLWLIPTRKKVASSELQQAVLRAADRAVQTAAAVKNVYAHLQYTQRAAELIRQNQQIVDQSTQIISVRQTAGEATQTAVNLSQIRALKLRSELMSTEAEHKAAQRELLMLMGLAAGPDTWHVEAIPEGKGDVIPPESEEGLLAIAGENRLDVSAALWRAQAAEQNIRLMKLEGLPDLALGLAFERAPAARSNNPSWLGEAGNTAARGLMDRAMGMPSPVMLPPAFSPKMREPKYAIGPMLDMEIPIFDWNQARAARAVHEYQQRLAEYEGKLQEVIRTVRAKRVMLQQAYDQVRFYHETIMPAVERNLDIARRTFIAGQEDLTVYLEVQEDLLMNRLKLLQFHRDYLLNLAELEREVGGSLGGAPNATRPATTSAASS